MLGIRSRLSIYNKSFNCNINIAYLVKQNIRKIFIPFVDKVRQIATFKPKFTVNLIILFRYE